ncbi:MAG: hypothetical protein VX938_02860, partial [Myxococcota bacterium]|nr:hypothetical protein [Myxococcota bacterium]
MKGACVCDTADSVCHDETTVASCDASGSLIFDSCSVCAPPYGEFDQAYCKEGSQPGVAGCACRSCADKVGYCHGRECGDDGCGGSCGDCASLYEGNHVCNDAGTCECAPDCDGKECGDDGCGGTCGVLECGYECTQQGKLRFKGCDGRECGPDVGQEDGASCGYTCPFTPPGQPKVDGDFAGHCSSCTATCEDGICVEPEDPVKTLCGERECGFVSCGISCGTCACGELCNEQAGVCENVEQALCGASSCGVVPCATGSGSVSCGESSGLCPVGSYCEAGECVGQCADSVLCGTPEIGMGCCTGLEACIGGKCCVPAYQWECEVDLNARCLVDSCGQKDGASCESCAYFCDAESGLCIDCAQVCEVEEGQIPCGTVDGCVCGEPVCSAGAQCVDNICVCEPQCVGKECGPDGCGGFCGECTDGGVCDAVKGLCECIPACDGKQCGPDGCGSTCGECLEGLTCDGVSGSCYCLPDCTGKFCGPDGCGGLCGECDGSEAACVDG